MYVLMKFYVKIMIVKIGNKTEEILANNKLYRIVSAI